MEFEGIICVSHANEIRTIITIFKKKCVRVLLSSSSRERQKDQEGSTAATVWRNRIAGQIWFRLLQPGEGEQWS